VTVFAAAPQQPSQQTGATAQLPPPQQPTSAGGPQRATIAAIALAVVFVGAVAVALAVVLTRKSSPPTPAPTTRTVIIQNPGQASAEPTTPTTPPATQPQPSSGPATYRTGTYALDYPAGWTVVEDNVDKGAYREAKMQSPDGGAAVLIDRAPGAPLDPMVEAQGVEVDTAKTTGYRRVKWDAATIGGKVVWEWVFDLPSGRRYDYFTNQSGGRFAVLGTGSDSASARKAARLVVVSIR
jgi:hypothetical protein